MTDVFSLCLSLTHSLSLSLSHTPFSSRVETKKKKTLQFVQDQSEASSDSTEGSKKNKVQKNNNQLTVLVESTSSALCTQGEIEGKLGKKWLDISESVWEFTQLDFRCNKTNKQKKLYKAPPGGWVYHATKVCPVFPVALPPPLPKGNNKHTCRTESLSTLTHTHAHTQQCLTFSIKEKNPEKHTGKKECLFFLVSQIRHIRCQDTLASLGLA